MKYRNIDYLKQKRVSLIFCLIFLLLQHMAFGQQGKAYLTISESAPNILLEISVLKNGLNSGHIDEVDPYEWEPGVAPSLEVPLKDSLSYLRIKVSDKTDLYARPSKFSNFFYLLAQGDSICIENLLGDIHFTGMGSEKWNCINQLYKHQDIGSRHLTNKLIKEGDYKSALLADKAKLDSLLAVQQAVLKKFQPKLSKQVYDLIYVDLLAGDYKKWGFIISTKTRNLAFVKAKKDLWKEYWTTFNFPLNDEKLLTQSYLYADFLYDKIKFGLILLRTNEKGHPYRRQSGDLLAAIDQMPKGLLKDKLYLIAIYQNLNLRTTNINKIDSLIANMGINRYREQVEALRRNQKGNLAFNFNLPDQYGNRHRLADYQGKLLIMDFWFTGCHACRGLYEYLLKPVIERYQKEEDVVFISVNVDKSKDLWLTSLKEETYSSPDEINLYTEGAGRYHDILKHYFILGFPTVVMISKEGRIITTSPPRPQNKADIPNAKSAFIDLIETNR